MKCALWFKLSCEVYNYTLISIEIFLVRSVLKEVNSIKEKLAKDKNRSVFTLGQAEVEYIQSRGIEYRSDIKDS